MVVDPWGTVISKLDDPLATGIAVADLDMQQLRDVRAKMPIWDHRTAAQQLCGGSN
jgi:deaminated glutathione amidase